MHNADVSIYGAGILGLSIAFECLQRGASVHITEIANYKSSASYGIVGALAPHAPDDWTPNKQFQLESLLLAEQWWSDVERVSGIRTGYGRIGRLQPINNKHTLELAHQRQLSAEQNWGSHACWEIISLREIDTFCPISPTGLLIRDTLSSRIYPRLAMDSLLQATTILGAGISAQWNGISGCTVYATGTQGLIDLSSEFGAFLGAGEKGQALVIDYSAPDTYFLNGNGITIVPHISGLTAIGSTVERYFENPKTTDHRLNELYKRACTMIPEISDARIVSKWAHLRPRSVTREPILGRHPIVKHCYIANGAFKTGLGYAPKIAQSMANLILDGVDTIPNSFRLTNILKNLTKKTA